jgi:hypothetical protein
MELKNDRRADSQTKPASICKQAALESEERLPSEPVCGYVFEARIIPQATSSESLNRKPQAYEFQTRTPCGETTSPECLADECVRYSSQNPMLLDSKTVQ